MVHNDSLSKVDLALIALKTLTPKELNQSQRTIAKMIGYSLSTTQRALKLLLKESPPKPEPRKTNVSRHTNSSTDLGVGGTPPPTYDHENIKALIQNTCVDIIKRRDSRNLGKALDILTKPEFIERGDIKDGIYWTSETPPYERPFWLYPWQPLGIDLFRQGNLLYLGSRQAIGKTLTAVLANHEDMLAIPGTVITIVAPTVPLAKRLLHQMYHETIVVKKCEPRPEGGWEQIPTELRINLWEDIFRAYVLYDGVLEKVYKNGSRIQVLTLDVAAVQGLSSDVIHIEEFDKIVKLTKQGEISDKLQAVAALLPQLRARPNSRIRITCNMASGLFDLLYDAVYEFGRYFYIYQEIGDSNIAHFTGLHEIANENVIYKDKKGIPTIPTIDDLLKKLMTVLVSSSFAAQQISNIKSHSEELFNPKKVKLAYQKGKNIDQSRTLYPRTGMGADPGAGHAYAFIVLGSDGSGTDREITHLWSQNYYAADNWESRYNSKLEEMVDIVSDQYCILHCQYFATESNSGARMITPHIKALVKKKLTEDPRFNHGKSRAHWKSIYSNFGGESPEGKDIPSIVPKSIFIRVLSTIFEYGLIALQERTEAEQSLHREIILYDPSKSSEKFKGDQADALLHCAFHLVGGNEEKFLNELEHISKPLRLTTW